MKPEVMKNKEIEWCEWLQRLQHVYLHRWPAALHKSRRREGGKQQRERRRALVAWWRATAIYWLTGGFMRRRSSEHHLNLKEHKSNKCSEFCWVWNVGKIRIRRTQTVSDPASICPVRRRAEETASRRSLNLHLRRRDRGEEEQRGVQTVILEREEDEFKRRKIFKVFHLCWRLNRKIKGVWEEQDSLCLNTCKSLLWELMNPWKNILVTHHCNFYGLSI